MNCCMLGAWEWQWLFGMLDIVAVVIVSYSRKHIDSKQWSSQFPQYSFLCDQGNRSLTLKELSGMNIKWVPESQLEFNNAWKIQHQGEEGTN